MREQPFFPLKVDLSKAGYINNFEGGIYTSVPEKNCITVLFYIKIYNLLA